MEQAFSAASALPLVSVIIPVYNVKPYLAEALGSVVHQSYPQLEILVIDDGSTDGSGALCDHYAAHDPRIRVIHQSNRGLSAARNAGLDAMTGQAVAFLDSDDAFSPEMIRAMLEAMQREQADLVVCSYSVHPVQTLMTAANAKHRKCSSRPRGGCYDRVAAIRALADGQLENVVWNKLYSSALWRDLRFPEGHVYEDVETAFRVYDNVRRLCVLDDILVSHRLRPGSITAVSSEANIRDWCLAHGHLRAFFAAQTAEIIPAERLRRFQQRELAMSILQYIRYIQHCGRDESAFGKTFRQEIIVYGRTLSLCGAPLRTKAAWWLLCRHSLLLRILILFFTRLYELHNAIFLR